MSRDDPPRSMTVAAAVIRDAAGRILLARRPAGRHMAGLWEFPGGKLEAGEAPAAALVRELREELGIGAEVGALLERAVHREPGLQIELLFFEVRITVGSPTPLDGQTLAWVAPEDLPDYPMPPADAVLVRRLHRGGRKAGSPLRP